ATESGGDALEVMSQAHDFLDGARRLLHHRFIVERGSDDERVAFMERTIARGADGDVVNLVAQQSLRLDLGARVLPNLCLKAGVDLDDQLQVARRVSVGWQELDVLDTAGELSG